VGPCTQHLDIKRSCWKSHPSPLGSLSPDSSSAIHTALAPFLQAQCLNEFSASSQDCITRYCNKVCRRRRRAESGQPTNPGSRSRPVTYSENETVFLFCFCKLLCHTITLMRRFLSTMAAGARKFAPLKEGAAANSHLPKLRVGNSGFYTFVHACILLIRLG
jgi:hypothetical protein